MHQYRFAILLAGIVGIVADKSAHAHPGHGELNGGFIHGVMHPLFGLDHLLAMVAIGLVAAQIGGVALWAVPGAFVASVIAGGAIGMSGYGIPLVELGIALSVLLLGVALAINKKHSLVVPIVAAAIFGAFHGHAHGTELPALASPSIYGLGFVVMTIVLHVIGVFCGRMATESVRGQSILRYAGVAIGTVGLMLMLR